MAKGAKGGMKAKLIEKHASEQLKDAKKPTEEKTWEMVCDCKKDDCADRAPRKKIDTFAPTHADRRSTAPARLQDEPSAPAKAAVPKGTRFTPQNAAGHGIQGHRKARNHVSDPQSLWTDEATECTKKLAVEHEQRETTACVC